jgi:hypothetical protein
MLTFTEITTTPKKPKINNTDLLANSGLRIVHCHYEGARAVTIAYERINRSHLKISTAVCHKADTFSKKMGTQTAIKNFQKGNTIVVPADRDMPATVQLRQMFGLTA